MSVILTQDFKVAPDGHTVQTYKKGDTVSGKVAEIAIRAGAASSLPAEPKRTPKPKFKKPAKFTHEG